VMDRTAPSPRRHPGEGRDPYPLPWQLIGTAPMDAETSSA
jgi:hypothetical protein